MNCSIEARLLGVSWCNLNLPEVSFFCLERGQIMLTELGLWGTDMVSAYTTVGMVGSFGAGGSSVRTDVSNAIVTIASNECRKLLLADERSATRGISVVVLSGLGEPPIWDSNSSAPGPGGRRIAHSVGDNRH